MMRYCLAYICFWIGHMFSLPLRTNWDWVMPICWRPYQKFMEWSSVIQGNTDQGPWISVIQGDTDQGPWIKPV